MIPFSQFAPLYYPICQDDSESERLHEYADLSAKQRKAVQVLAVDTIRDAASHDTSLAESFHNVIWEEVIACGFHHELTSLFFGRSPDFDSNYEVYLDCIHSIVSEAVMDATCVLQGDHNAVLQTLPSTYCYVHDSSFYSRREP